MSTDFDYIIIGSGAGGSALAYRLAQSRRASVLVLEYGGADSDPLHQVPLAHFLTEADERYTYRYATEPPAGNEAGETWVRGDRPALPAPACPPRRSRRSSKTGAGNHQG